MVALKLILQSLAGVVAFGGTIGGTVALSIGRRHYETKIIEVGTNESGEAKNSFYLVSAAISIADTTPEKELFSDVNSTQKNYQCINNFRSKQTITKDSSCILYSLKNTANTSLKISEIKAFTQNTGQASSIATKVIKKTEIKKNKFFLLQANEKLNESWITNKKTSIYLTIKNTTDFFLKSNLYVILQVHAKISPDEVTGATDTIIAKATSNKQTSTAEANVSTSTYQCSFTSDNTKTNCKLSKLSSYTDGNSFNFANQTITTRFQTTNTELNAYYLIQSDEIKKHEIKDLKSSTAKYIETNPQNNTYTTPLTIETAVFVKLDNFSTKLSELIINN